MILLHPHAIGNLMGEARSIPKDAPEHILKINRRKKRTDEDQAILDAYRSSILSETAKSYCLKLAKQHVYEYTTTLEKQKVIQKGLQCEDDSIELLNIVTNHFFSKNAQRVTTELLSGEADIVEDDGIWDVKSAWSLDTFPVLPEDAHSDLYEWQGRAYMHLYDKQHFTLAYCLVSTPDALCQWEDYRLHQVEHIPPEMRVTLWHCTRDLEKEALMLGKCRRAQVYIEQLIAEIKAAHNY